MVRIKLWLRDIAGPIKACKEPSSCKDLATSNLIGSPLPGAELTHPAHSRCVHLLGRVKLTTKACSFLQNEGVFSQSTGERKSAKQERGTIPGGKAPVEAFCENGRF